MCLCMRVCVCESSERTKYYVIIRAIQGDPYTEIIPPKQEMRDSGGHELEVSRKHSAMLSPGNERSRPLYLEIKGLVDSHC